MDVEQTCVTLPLVPSRSDITLGFGFKVVRKAPHKLGLKATSRTVLLPTAWWIMRDYGKQIGDAGEAFINEKVEIELDAPKYMQYAWQHEAFEQEQRTVGVNLAADAHLLQDSFSDFLSDFTKREIQITLH